MSYRRLTLKDRYQIDAYLQSGKTKSEIAKLLNRSKSTITRELRRVDQNYVADSAQVLSSSRASSRRAFKFKLQPQELEFVSAQIVEGLSPEQIIGRLSLSGKDLCSVQTIYNYIARDASFRSVVRPHLRILKKERKDRKKVGWKPFNDARNNRIFIGERPKVVDERKRLGDLERDTIFGKACSALLLSIVDRVSKKTWLIKITKKCSHEIHRATVKALKNENVLTITNDNGTEFAQHNQTAKDLKAQIYFAKAYASWQRGTNENTNGLVRQYCPRRVDIARFTDAEIKAIEDRLNNRPRKCLGFKTPNEVHQQLKAG